MKKEPVTRISKKLNSVKSWTVQLGFWGWNILIRPSYEFYYANGFAKAAVTAFALAVNLILYILLFSIVMSNLFAFDFTSEGLNGAILERHILWPTQGRWYVKECPKESIYTKHQLLSEIDIKAEKLRLEKMYPNRPNIASEFIVDHFKVTKALAADMALYFRLFLGSPLKGTLPENPIHLNYRKEDGSPASAPLQGHFAQLKGLRNGKDYELEVIVPQEFDFELPQRDLVKSPLWFYIAALVTAYVSLLLNIRANVESIVTPTPGGPKPPLLRNSWWRRAINQIPGVKTLQINTQIFLMLPVAGLIFVALLEVLGRGLEEIQLSFLGFLLTSFLSVFISGGAFFLIYASVIRKEISWFHLLLGALYGAILWLFGRWFFTEYIAVSLYRNLKFFSLAFIMLTWLYYFCCTMFIGLHVAFILQHKNLKEVIAAWIRKDSEMIGHHVLLQKAIHIDFLVRLGLSHLTSSNVEDTPAGWVNQEDVGNVDGFCRNFADEAIFNLAAACPEYIESRLWRGAYQFRLKKDPDQIDAWEILNINAVPFKALDDFLEGYPSARVLKELSMEVAVRHQMTIGGLIRKVQQNVQKKGGTRQITKSSLLAIPSMPRTSFFTRKKIPFAHSQTETKPMIPEKTPIPPMVQDPHTSTSLSMEPLPPPSPSSPTLSPLSSANYTKRRTAPLSPIPSPTPEGLNPKDFSDYEVPTVAFSLSSPNPEDIQLLKEELSQKNDSLSSQSRSLPFSLFPENPTEPMLLFSPSPKPNFSPTNASLPLPIQEDSSEGNSLPPSVEKPQNSPKPQDPPKKPSFFGALGVDESTTFYSDPNKNSILPTFPESEKPLITENTENLDSPSSQTSSDFLRLIQPDPKMFLDPETEKTPAPPEKDSEEP